MSTVRQCTARGDFTQWCPHQTTPFCTLLAASEFTIHSINRHRFQWSGTTLPLTSGQFLAHPHWPAAQSVTFWPLMTHRSSPSAVNITRRQKTTSGDMTCHATPGHRMSRHRHACHWRQRHVYSCILISMTRRCPRN